MSCKLRKLSICRKAFLLSFRRMYTRFVDDLTVFVFQFKISCQFSKLPVWRRSSSCHFEGKYVRLLNNCVVIVFQSKTNFSIQDVSSVQDTVDLHKVLIPTFGMKTRPICRWFKLNHHRSDVFQLESSVFGKVPLLWKVFIFPHQWKICSTYPPRKYDCFPGQGLFKSKVSSRIKMSSQQSFI